MSTTSTSKHAFTSGAAKVREFDTVFEVRSEDGIRITTTSWHNNSPWFPTKDQSRANVALIAEAFTVAHETGLTPRQLAEQRKDLLAALKRVRDALELYGLDDFDSTNEEELEAVNAAIAKATGSDQ